MTLEQFLFDHTVPQLEMLVQARLERDKAQDKNKEQPTSSGTMQEMADIERAFG